MHHNAKILMELLTVGGKGDLDLLAKTWAHNDVYEVLYLMIVNNIPLGHLSGVEFANPMHWLAEIQNHEFIFFAMQVSSSNGDLLPQGFVERHFPNPPAYVFDQGWKQ